MKIYFYARALTQKKPLSLPWRLEQCPYVMSRETETWDSGKETSVGEIIGKSLSGSTKSQTAASFSRLITQRRANTSWLSLATSQLWILESLKIADEQSRAMQSLFLSPLSHCSFSLHYPTLI